MRHRKANKKLGRGGAHRVAMIRNLLTSLVEHEELETTHTRCKMLKREVDKLITIGKKGTVHHRRVVARTLYRRDLVNKLFDVIAPRYDGRPGGYSRIMPLGFRRGDGAAVSLIQLIPEGEKVTPKTSRKAVEEPKIEAGAVVEETTVAEVEPEAPMAAAEEDTEK